MESADVSARSKKTAHNADSSERHLDGGGHGVSVECYRALSTTNTVGLQAPKVAQRNDCGHNRRQRSDRGFHAMSSGMNAVRAVS